MNSYEWRPSSPARAVAHVLEALLPGRVARQMAAEPAEAIVYSYTEDFDELWRLPNSLLEWLGRGSGRHVVVVWDGGGASGRRIRGDPSEHLPASDWAAAATLATQATWRITIVDLAPRRHAESAKEDGAPSRAEAQHGLLELLTHVAVVQPWDMRRFFSEVASAACPAMPVPGVYATLEDLWCSRHEKAIRNRPPSVETLRRAPLAAYTEALKRENARFRHGGGDGFGAFLPAVRILLGAMQAGTVSADTGRDLLGRIRARQPTAPPETGYDFELLHRYVELRQRLGDFDNGHPPVASERAAGGRKLLLIDDEYETAGWDLVLPPLFPAWEVEAAGPSMLVEKLGTPPALASYNLVLLDHRLGKDVPREGLEFLAEIRSVNPFVPVVLFTMEDDSNLFSEAIETGATAYLVKELADTADRDSVAYFEFLRRSIQSFEQMSINGPRLALDLWNRLDVIHRRLPWDRSRLDEDESLVFQGVVAIERAIFFWAHGMEVPEATRREAHRAIGIDIGQCIAAIDELGAAPRLEAARSFANACKHGKVVQNKTDEEIASLLAETIEALARKEKVKDLLLDAQPESDAMAQSGKVVGDCEAIQAESRRTHTERSIWGAVRFVLGYYSARGGWDDEFRSQFDATILDVVDFMGKTPDGRAGVLRAVHTLGRYEPLGAAAGNEEVAQRDNVERPSLLLIDDTAAEDGWLLALRTALPEILVHHIAFAGIQDAATACRLAGVSHAVLLDLRLPAAGGAIPHEGVGLELLKRLRRDAPYVPVVVLSADEDVFRTRACVDAGAVGYFPKTWRRLPSAPNRDWADPGFYEQYYQRLRTYIDRALDGPPAVLARFRAQCSRLSRKGRYRGVVDGEDLGAWIGQLSDFVERLAWLHLDAHRSWLHGRLVREPDAWVRQAQRAPAFVEGAVCLSGLVEDLIRRIILTHPQTKDADVELAALGTLIEISRSVLSPSISSALTRLVELRNAAVYKTPSADRADAPQRLDLADALRLAVELLPPLCNRVVEQQTSARKERGASSASRDLAPRLAEMITATFGDAGPAANRRSANEYVQRRRGLEARLRETETVLRAARQAESNVSTAAEAGRLGLDRLQNERDERIAAAAMSAGRRGARTVEDFFNPKIKAAEGSLRAAEASLHPHVQAARAAHAAANAARRQFEEHLKALPPLPDDSGRRRWAVLREWLEERSLEERVATTLDEPPGCCCWDGEVLSKDVEDIVAALSGGGRDPQTTWEGLRAWIEGASVADAMSPADAPAAAASQDRNQPTRGSLRGPAGDAVAPTSFADAASAGDSADPDDGSRC